MITACGTWLWCVPITILLVGSHAAYQSTQTFNLLQLDSGQNSISSLTRACMQFIHSCIHSLVRSLTHSPTHATKYLPSRSGSCRPEWLPEPRTVLAFSTPATVNSVLQQHSTQYSSNSQFSSPATVNSVLQQQSVQYSSNSECRQHPAVVPAGL